MNYYEILKISKDASDKEIKNAYKKMVKKYHPDLYVADKEFAEKKIKEINEAYNILSNEESRLEYDEYLNDIEQDNVQEVVYTTQSNYKNGFTEEANQYNSFLVNNIFDKFENLSKKTKIKIFLVVLMIVFIIFLNNLMKLKNTLEEKKVDGNLTSINKNNYSNEQNTIIDDDNINNEFNYDQELENQFNEFYKSLMGEYFNTVW